MRSVSASRRWRSALMGMRPKTSKTARCSLTTSVTAGAMTATVTMKKTLSAMASTIELAVCTESVRPALMLEL